MEYGVYGGSKTTVNFREDVTTKLLNNLSELFVSYYIHFVMLCLPRFFALVSLYVLYSF